MLGTKCLPVAFYLGQGCPTRIARSGRATFSSIELSLFTAVPLRGSEKVPLHAEMYIVSIKVPPPATSSPARAPAREGVNAEVRMGRAK